MDERTIEIYGDPGVRVNGATYRRVGRNAVEVELPDGYVFLATNAEALRVMRGEPLNDWRGDSGKDWWGYEGGAR